MIRKEKQRNRHDNSHHTSHTHTHTHTTHANQNYVPNIQSKMFPRCANFHTFSFSLSSHSSETTWKEIQKSSHSTPQPLHPDLSQTYLDIMSICPSVVALNHLWCEVASSCPPNTGHLKETSITSQVCHVLILVITLVNRININH